MNSEERIAYKRWQKRFHPQANKITTGPSCFHQQGKHLQVSGMRMKARLHSHSYARAWKRSWITRVLMMLWLAIN